MVNPFTVLSPGRNSSSLFYYKHWTIVHGQECGGINFSDGALNSPFLLPGLNKRAMGVMESIFSFSPLFLQISLKEQG
jgi:hypothetical protein